MHADRLERYERHERRSNGPSAAATAEDRTDRTRSARMTGSPPKLPAPTRPPNSSRSCVRRTADKLSRSHRLTPALHPVVQMVRLRALVYSNAPCQSRPLNPCAMGAGCCTSLHIHWILCKPAGQLSYVRLRFEANPLAVASLVCCLPGASPPGAYIILAQPVRALSKTTDAAPSFDCLEQT